MDNSQLHGLCNHDAKPKPITPQARINCNSFVDPCPRLPANRKRSCVMRSLRSRIKVVRIVRCKWQDEAWKQVDRSPSAHTQVYIACKAISLELLYLPSTSHQLTCSLLVGRCLRAEVLVCLRISAMTSPAPDQ